MTTAEQQREAKRLAAIAAEGQRLLVALDRMGHQVAKHERAERRERFRRARGRRKGDPIF